MAARKLAKLKDKSSGSDSFKETALEWFGKHESRWSSHYAIRERRNLENDLFPFLGQRRISEIEPIELLAVIRKVEERGALDVAHRVLSTARAVWRYAAITEPVKLGQLIRVIRGYQGGPIVRAALQLAPMLSQRPGELRVAPWAEINLDAALCTILAARMKRKKEGKENGEPHLVPLPAQAVTILRELHPLTGHGALVFPGERSHERTAHPLTACGLGTAPLSYLGDASPCT